MTIETLSYCQCPTTPPLQIWYPISDRLGKRLADATTQHLTTADSSITFHLALFPDFISQQEILGLHTFLFSGAQ